MDHDKRLLISLVVTVAVVSLWWHFIVKPNEDYKRRQRLRQTASQQVRAPDVTPAAPPVAVSSPAPLAAPEAAAPAIPRRPEELRDVDLRDAIVTLTSAGARIKSWRMKHYRRGAGKDAVPVDVLAGEPTVALALDKVPGYAPDASYRIEPSEDPLRVTFVLQSGDLEVTRTYQFHAATPVVDHDVRVRNLGTTGAAIEDRSVISIGRTLTRDEMDDEPSMWDPAVDVPQPTCYARDGAERRIPKSMEAGKPEDIEGHASWTGIDTRYFLAAVVAREVDLARCTLLRAGERRIETHLHVPTAEVKAGESRTHRYAIFIGPKHIEALEAAGADLDKSVDFNVLGVRWDFLAEPMLWFLKAASAVFHNYGIAIILLTMLVKLLLLPLTHRMMANMERMKQLKPEMDGIREKYGEDRERYNQEVAKLFRTHKVNPLGGCLPMLFQMPIYIALYRTLYCAVELYQAPFIPGWIDDLSTHDPVFIMPVILGGVMFVQQKMTPQTLEGAQAKVMLYFMPVFFTAIMLLLPSGLVLYIFVNTVLGIAHQRYLGRRATAAGAQGAARLVEDAKSGRRGPA
jgi:YidC/Oxa1 family membrane protein insertase